MRSCNAVGACVLLRRFVFVLCIVGILCLCLVRRMLSTLVVVAPCVQCISPVTQQSPHLAAGALQVVRYVLCCYACNVRRAALLQIVSTIS